MPWGWVRIWGEVWLEFKLLGWERSDSDSGIKFFTLRLVSRVTWSEDFHLSLDHRKIQSFYKVLLHKPFKVISLISNTSFTTPLKSPSHPHQ